MQFALDRFGTYDFRRAVEPAIRFATEGFPITRNVAGQIVAARDYFRKDPGSAQLFLNRNQPRKQGERFRNPDLGKMLQTLARRNSVDSFYRGDIAERITRAFQNNRGLVTAKDFAGYRAREVSSLHVEWQGYDLYTAPLGAGGLTTLETIAILKALGWQKMLADGPRRTRDIPRPPRSDPTRLARSPDSARRSGERQGPRRTPAFSRLCWGACQVYSSVAEIGQTGQDANHF